MYRIKTGDEQILEVERYILRSSGTLNDVVVNNNDVIPDIIHLETINTNVLQAIIDYYTHYRDEEIEERDFNVMELPDFDQEFIESHHDIVETLVMNCCELGFLALENACCKYIANMARGKTPAELREIYGIPFDSDDDDEGSNRNNKGGFGGGERGPIQANAVTSTTD